MESLESRILFHAAITVADEFVQSVQSEVDSLLNAAAGRPASTTQSTQPSRAYHRTTEPPKRTVLRGGGETQPAAANPTTEQTQDDVEDRPQSDFRYVLRPGTGFTAQRRSPLP